MTKNIFRTIGLALVAFFTFSILFSIFPIKAEARSYNVWHELREQSKRDTVSFMRRIWREYQNDYIQQIRDRNRWRREERREASRASRNSYRSEYNAPQCVYYITANTSQGEQVLGSLQTSNPLDEHQEKLLQMIADHIRSGQPINTVGMSYSDRSKIKKYCRDMGIPIRITNSAYYFQ